METPNLSYIHSMSGGDKTFEKQILEIIKKEFPKEKDIYFKNLQLKKYSLVAENVHKLKHKISILGLEESYAIAVTYENGLKEGDISLKEDFNRILQTITNFLNSF